MCGLDHEAADEAGVSVTLDETTNQMIFSLTRLVNLKLNHWNTDAIEVCERLVSHLSPPRSSKKKRMPLVAPDADLTELDVSGVNLRKDKNIQTLKEIIKQNKR